MISQKLFNECHHVRYTSLSKALTYCFTISILFVVSLYLVVPSNIRVLPRNDHRQIKWRFFSVISTSLFSTCCFYPFYFCQSNEVLLYDYRREDNKMGKMIFPAITFMGWTCWKSRYIRVLLHTIILFIGPLFVNLFRAYLKTIYTVTNRRNNSQGFFSVFVKRLHDDIIYPHLPISMAHVRDYIIAPLSEEVVFRGCMASPLLSTGMNLYQVSFIAPIFFGTAHLHHAYEKLSRGMPLKIVLVQNTIQFLVTYVFGVYSMYVFLMTGSVFVVTTCHSFCNIMGLPDLDFLSNEYSLLFPYRKCILAIHVIGIVLFVMGFVFGEKFVYYDYDSNNVFTWLQKMS